MSRWRSIAFILAVFSHMPAWAYVVASFDTIGITPVSGPVLPTQVYTFDFTLNSLASATSTPLVTGPSSFGYLNVVNGDQWVIRNEPIPLVQALTEEAQHFWFTQSSTAFSSVKAIFNSDPFVPTLPSLLPTIDSQWANVGLLPANTAYGSNDLHGEVGGGTPVVSPPPAAVPIIEGYLRGGVPDIKQLNEECGPTSTLNSLLWLAKKYGLSTDKFPKLANGSIDQQALLKQIANAMQKHNTDGSTGLPNNWNPESPIVNGDRGYPGLDRGAFEAGLKDILKATMLPVVEEGGVNDPKAQGASTFDFVKKELKKGQDVEFLITWPRGNSHWVTVTGYIDAGKDNKTLIVHDPGVANGNNYWKIKDDGSLTAPIGTANRAVAESVVPEPSLLALLCTALGMLVGFNRRQPA